jgi:hypothetical protein
VLINSYSTAKTPFRQAGCDEPLEFSDGMRKTKENPDSSHKSVREVILKKIGGEVKVRLVQKTIFIQPRIKADRRGFDSD